MTSLTHFIEGRLKLQINARKSAVARPSQRSFLGFTVTDEPLVAASGQAAISRLGLSNGAPTGQGARASRPSAGTSVRPQTRVRSRER
jgi:hypothetical protein